MNIIGLGSVGCQIAQNFKEFPNYRIFSIDVKDNEYQGFLRIAPQKTHEDYEKNYTHLNLQQCRGRAVVILSGASTISGIVLRLLEQIKDNEVTILYIKPDDNDLSKEMRTQDKITFGILQQYVRSDVFNKIYIINNKDVENILGNNISISNYWSDINRVISSTYNMINVFSNTEPLLTTFSTTPETAKIATLGVVSFDNFDEKVFYNLKAVRNKKYFFGVNKETLEDKDLLHRIRSFVSSRSTSRCDVGFSIYSTSYEENYVYCAHYASFIQEDDDF
jgi:hypothetical protein